MMIRFLSLISILIPISLFAQGFGSFSHDQPYFSANASGGPSPPVPNLKYWWVFSDMPTNTTVTNWVDRISSSVWTNGATASRPTNTASGVHFVGSGGQNYFLTNVGVGPLDGGIGVNNGTNSWWFIINLDVQGNFNFLSFTPSTDNGLFFSSGQLIYTDGINFPLGPTLTTGHFVDVMVTSRSGANQISFYTNGVLAVNTTSTFIAGDTLWKSLGNAPSGFFRGYVRELAIWATNTLTAANAVTLHTYATNTYGYTP